MNTTKEIIRNENELFDKSRSTDIVEEKKKIKGEKQSKEKKKSEEQLIKEINTDVYKCNKCDEVCETETCLDSHMLKKHEEENDFKWDECGFSCACLVTLRKHVNSKHPHPVN